MAEVRWTPQAADDLEAITAFRNPFGYVRIEAKFRRVLLRKIPYSLIYLPSHNELLVVSFFHQHREPGVLLVRM